MGGAMVGGSSRRVSGGAGAGGVDVNKTHCMYA